MPGIEPGAFHMQSERATTALHPHTDGSTRRRISVPRWKPKLSEMFIRGKIETW